MTAPAVIFYAVLRICNFITKNETQAFFIFGYRPNGCKK